MFNALNRFRGKVFSVLNKWSTKKANITWGFTLVMFAFGAFYSFILTQIIRPFWVKRVIGLGLFFVKRHHLFCWFYFTTILHFAAPLTAMKIPLAGAST